MTELRFSVEGTPRLTLSDATSSFATNLDVSGNLDVTGNLTAPNMQPVLTSVSDGGVFHTVLGTGNAANKMKAISSTSGIGITSVFDSIIFS